MLVTNVEPFSTRDDREKPIRLFTYGLGLERKRSSHRRPNQVLCSICCRLSVSIDNESLEDCTVIKVDSLNKQDLLLEVVQVLTDLNLTITKGYISSDAGWFMDVFHVTDEHGNKLADSRSINLVQQAIGAGRTSTESPKANALGSKFFTPEPPLPEHTAIEMTAADRPGLFSEISAALADLHCNIVEAHAWSHNARLACVAYISDQTSDSPIDDPHRLANIEQHLTTVLRAAPAPVDVEQQEVKTADLVGGEAMMTNVERRLHQLMLSVKDYNSPSSEPSTSPRSPLESMDSRVNVLIESCYEKGYSIVTVECKDRPRLMFDTVCTLIDMQCVIFHASLHVCEGYAFQEYFIRQTDGRPLNSDGEKDRVIKCLEAAMERRVCEGMKLEMCAHNRVGLLSDITRLLRENGLAVVRADVATQGEKANNVFYLRDTSGNNNVNTEIVESVKKEIGAPIHLQVKNETFAPSCRSPDTCHFSIKDMLKSQIERFSHKLLH